ncbi:hypothetical protein BVRB_8g201380 [Beta vulgaris subsp. vulgaris]|uniref:Uncharacterized protein n=1 Tax=Beta vulgaris subsp. vulgaris TaxID=3555 RepID=A0A0J8B9E6_BETVV|nr:hypothetical protein BVRB_8g201380 [Beta vulgaris subsp. vulgaris]
MKISYEPRKYWQRINQQNKMTCLTGYWLTFNHLSS